MDTEKGTGNPDIASTHVSVRSMGTAYDQQDMRVMGKLQELRVKDVFTGDAQPTDTPSETSALSPF